MTNGPEAPSRGQGVFVTLDNMWQTMQASEEKLNTVLQKMNQVTSLAKTVENHSEKIAAINSRLAALAVVEGITLAVIIGYLSRAFGS